MITTQYGNAVSVIGSRRTSEGVVIRVKREMDGAFMECDFDYLRADGGAAEIQKAVDDTRHVKLYGWKE